MISIKQLNILAKQGVYSFERLSVLLAVQNGDPQKVVAERAGVSSRMLLRFIADKPDLLDTKPFFGKKQQGMKKPTYSLVLTSKAKRLLKAIST